MMEKLIDIIIPAYKSQITIVKTLASIVEQDISDVCTVTIVNDGDGIGYADIVQHYSKYLDIRELLLPENRGPGIARQYGINNTSLKYIMFADADDTFYNPFALHMMLEVIEKSTTCSMVSAKHYLAIKKPQLKFIIYHHNFVWVFAKIYRRSFIEKYNIHFPDSRSNEDVGFNQSIHLLAINPEEQPINLDEIVYIWHENPNSITRVDEDFVYSTNMTGFIDNMIFAIRKCEHIKGVENKHLILITKIKMMADLYIFLEETNNMKPEFTESNFQHCVKYYNEIFQIIELTQDSSFISKLVLEELQMKYETLKRFIPTSTYYQFMDKIRKAANEQKD